MDRFVDLLLEMIDMVLRFIFSTKAQDEEASAKPEEPEAERMTPQDERIESYKVLGLEPGAAQHEVRRRFRELALKYHPDRNQGDAQAAAMMQAICAFLAELWLMCADAARKSTGRMSCCAGLPTRSPQSR